MINSWSAANTPVNGDDVNRIPSKFSRLAAATALLATATLFSAPHAAAAAEALPELFVSFRNEPVAEIDNNGSTVGMYVYNYGEAPATAVTVTLDLSKVSDAVTASVPDNSDCKLADTKVTCNVGALNAGQVESVYPLKLTAAKVPPPATPARSPSPSTAPKTTWHRATTPPRSRSRCAPSGPDLFRHRTGPERQEKTPVGPGDTVPLYAGVGNEGDTPPRELHRTGRCSHRRHVRRAVQRLHLHRLLPGRHRASLTCTGPAWSPAWSRRASHPATVCSSSTTRPGRHSSTSTLAATWTGPSENYGVSWMSPSPGQERSAK